MKFIIDAQLPISLSFLLRHKGYDTIHTLKLPDKNKTRDKQVIKISITENRVVITKDSDFLESFLVKGEPKKIILLKTGNINNEGLGEIFSKHIEKMASLLKENSLIEINRNEIIVHV